MQADDRALHTRGCVDVSVVVVSYNRDAPLRQTLECLLRQDPAPREIILVDQSEHHDEAIQEFLDSVARGGLIKCIQQSDPNAQRARNRAIQEARGEVLLFVDDDVVMDDTLVKAHWENYQDPEIAAVCGFFLDPGQEAVDDLPADCKRPTTGWIYMPHSYTKRVESHLFPSGNGSVRRAVAMQVGGFDENFVFTSLDDTDFSCRLKGLGVRAVHDPRARLTHLKIARGGRRPAAINEYVLADSNRWYTWVYFFGMNFGWQSWRELLGRLRACVFRRANMIRPWHFARAVWHLLAGTARAILAISRGRKLAAWHMAPDSLRYTDQRKIARIG